VHNWHLPWFGDSVIREWGGDCHFGGGGDFFDCSEEFVSYVPLKVRVACLVFEGYNQEFHAFIVEPFV